MPVVLLFFGLKFKINVRDHNPPHVHVEGRGCTARINIKTLEIMSVNGFGRADMKLILEVLKDEDNLAALWEKWNEYRE
jgi:hypothetical protein